MRWVKDPALKCGEVREALSEVAIPQFKFADLEALRQGVAKWAEIIG
jgi:hypothetical protein